MDPDQKFLSWAAALEERHLSSLTAQEVGRALRALSSCYVERRARLPEGAALATAGKRAAFALFYGPVHFLVARGVVRALQPAPVSAVVDFGCGTGAAGASWALEASAEVAGFDRHPWVVDEANWTYRTLGLRGRARTSDIGRVDIPSRPRSAVVAAYAVNELTESTRSALLPRLLTAAGAGTAVLVIEPIARRSVPWWPRWEEAFTAAGGRSDEWRFPPSLPARQSQLAHAAGLRPTELTARSLYLEKGGTSRLR